MVKKLQNFLFVIFNSINFTMYIIIKGNTYCLTDNKNLFSVGFKFYLLKNKLCRQNWHFLNLGMIVALKKKKN